MAKEQDAHELRIFHQFAAAARLKIQPDSIQKRQPPEPDIQCVLADQGCTYFELVEILDSHLAQAVGNQITFQNRLPEEAAKYQLPNLTDALIFVDFARGRTSAKIGSAIQRLMTVLQELPAGHRGDVPVKQDPSLNGVVRTLRITRGSFVGPLFQVDGATFISDPIVERIEGKFTKRYTVGHPVELLAFYEMHPTQRAEYQLPDVDEFVRNNLHSSQFSRVWVFDAEHNAVLYRSS